MTRKTLLLVAGGAIAAAIVGTAIGASAADVDTNRKDSTPAAIAAPSGEPTDGPSGTPTLGGTGTPGQPSAGTEGIGRDRAAEIALGRSGGGQVTEVEREHEDGRAVWSVEINKDQTEFEVDVDRFTGEIVDFEQERDDDWDDDRDDWDDR